MIVTEREREAETQAEGEAGSMHREPDVGFDPGSPGSCSGPKAGAKPLRHPGIPILLILSKNQLLVSLIYSTVLLVSISLSSARIFIISLLLGVGFTCYFLSNSLVRG